MSTVTYNTIPVTLSLDGKENVHKIFYRQAGDSTNPTVLLLHGYPTSSHQYRVLIPLLVNKGYYIVAPDLPGFGQTESPPRNAFNYTFDNLAHVVVKFIDTLQLNSYYLYIHDYGAPVGLRIASTHPHQVRGIITQNGNAYDEGLSAAWAPVRQLWAANTPENRAAVTPFLSPEAIISFYQGGVPKEYLNRISPDGYTLDMSYMHTPPSHRAEMKDIQLDLWYSYGSNVALYSTWQKYFRDYQPPLLAVWGEYDPFFLPPGAEAFKRDIKNAQIHFLPTGHFALETHAQEISQHIHVFIERVEVERKSEERKETVE